MRARVEAAMGKLNYRPQTAVRGLRGRTYTIGILLPDLRNPLFADIFDGVIPQDRAVVGYDNSHIAALPQISLISIDQSGHLLGANAARLLIERIDGRSSENHFVSEPRLIARNSSQSPRQPGEGSNRGGLKSES